MMKEKDTKKIGEKKKAKIQILPRHVDILSGMADPNQCPSFNI
jgi:hypothetical protein